MATRISSKTTFAELQKLVHEVSSTAQPQSAVVILLLDQQLPAREIRHTKSDLVFLGFPDRSGKYEAKLIPHGHEFRVVVESRAGMARTLFLDQDHSI